ncbi:hypothetical protein EXIGLDRAFT_834314 [Exidia glandulosa HHB12029]|uniref:Uncharacterized protein n=1 Tax=Exidia glandulosa HHB12029 TaxID=1314781 RepID=A0A165JY05_EXIGL|nr:hypothetical protein EXIGLDRAFT_834314 [Exidia glandulosa HHB12029]
MLDNEHLAPSLLRCDLARTFMERDASSLHAPGPSHHLAPAHPVLVTLPIERDFVALRELSKCLATGIPSGRKLVKTQEISVAAPPELASSSYRCVLAQNCRARRPAKDESRPVPAPTRSAVVQTSLNGTTLDLSLVASHRPIVVCIPSRPDAARGSFQEIALELVIPSVWSRRSEVDCTLPSIQPRHTTPAGAHLTLPSRYPRVSTRDEYSSSRSCLRTSGTDSCKTELDGANASSGLSTDEGASPTTPALFMQ